MFYWYFSSAFQNNGKSLSQTHRSAQIMSPQYIYFYFKSNKHIQHLNFPCVLLSPQHKQFSKLLFMWLGRYRKLSPCQITPTLIKSNSKSIN